MADPAPSPRRLDTDGVLPPLATGPRRDPSNRAFGIDVEGVGRFGVVDGETNLDRPQADGALTDDKIAPPVGYSQRFTYGDTSPLPDAPGEHISTPAMNPNVEGAGRFGEGDGRTDINEATGGDVVGSLDNARASTDFHPAPFGDVYAALPIGNPPLGYPDIESGVPAGAALPEEPGQAGMGASATGPFSGILSPLSRPGETTQFLWSRAQLGSTLLKSFPSRLQDLYGDSVIYSKGRATTVNLATLQRVDLEQMQAKLAQEAFKFKYGGGAETFHVEGPESLRAQLKEYGVSLYLGPLHDGGVLG